MKEEVRRCCASLRPASGHRGRNSLEMVILGRAFSTPSGEGAEWLEDAYDSG